MLIPDWVRKAMEQYNGPQTGRVIINIELYKGGVTKMEIGSIVRIPSGNTEVTGQEVKPEKKSGSSPSA